MVAIPPAHPPTTANPAPEQQRSTPHTPRHAHTQPHHRSIRRRHLDTTRADGGFYYHRHPTTACRRRVTALWSQFPPHTHPQPPATRLQQAQPRPNTATNPRQRGFYYHRRPTTACRRRVAALWSQFPPRAHPQPPATASSMRISPHEPPVATAHASRRAPPRSMGAWPPWRHRLPLRHPQTRRAPTLVSCMIRRCPRWSTAT